MGRLEPVEARGSGRSRGERLRSRHRGRFGLAEPTYGPSPAAEANVGLTALILSTPEGCDWLLTLHSRPSTESR